MPDFDQFRLQLEEMGEDSVREKLAQGGFSPSERALAEDWLAQRKRPRRSSRWRQDFPLSRRGADLRSPLVGAMLVIAATVAFAAVSIVILLVLRSWTA